MKYRRRDTPLPSFATTEVYHHSSSRLSNCALFGMDDELVSYGRELQVILPRPKKCGFSVCIHSPPMESHQMELTRKSYLNLAARAEMIDRPQSCRGKGALL